MMKPKLIGYFGASLLEGPSWIAENSCLMFVSIEQQLIYLFEIETGYIQTIRTNGPVGCAVYIGDGVLWSAEKNGVYETNIHTGMRRFLVHPEPREYMRYNDGVLDHAGRFIFGTMGYGDAKEGMGKVFSYDGNSVKELIGGVTISNGIAFSMDGRFMYYIDSPSRKVAKYAYSRATGEVEFVGHVIEFSGPSVPDGMCMDDDGKLWIAEWEGGRVGRWDPISGELVDTLELPCNRVTSCTFGGKSGKTMFVTTASSEADKSGVGGGLFAVEII